MIFTNFFATKRFYRLTANPVSARHKNPAARHRRFPKILKASGKRLKNALRIGNHLKRMKYIFVIIIAIISAAGALAQTAEPILISKQNLDFKYLKTGDSTYVVYFKKTADGPAERMTLVKINVAPTTLDGRKAYAITQQWEGGDEVVHRAYTVHDAEDFRTLRHETWWKRTGYTAKFDFLGKQVSFDGTVSDADKTRITDDFNASFDAYNLSWHSDLTIFPLFPFKDGRVLRVNFYDPGASKAKLADYTVTGSETLSGSGGEKIDCWIMEYKSTMPSGGTASQRFWISKKTREVLKEEDQFPGGFRYKLKIGVSGEK